MYINNLAVVGNLTLKAIIGKSQLVILPIYIIVNFLQLDHIYYNAATFFIVNYFCHKSQRISLTKVVFLEWSYPNYCYKANVKLQLKKQSEQLF